MKSEQGGRPTTEDVRQAVHEQMQRYLDGRQQSQMPPPFPPFVGDAVRWWVDTMQKPCGVFEQPHLTSVVGGHGTRWEFTYRTRVLHCLSVFLRLSPKERDMIVAGREDGVYWQGEPVAQFLFVAKEAMQMRETGPLEYAKTPGEFIANVRRQRRNDAA